MSRSTPLDSTGETCPVARSVDIVGDRWSLLIVRDAFDGMRRFGDFQRSLGVARNILSDRLRKLVEAGVLDMQAASDGTAYQELGEDYMVSRRKDAQIKYHREQLNKLLGEDSPETQSA